MSLLINGRNFNPIQDGTFWGCSRMGSNKKCPLPKSCHKHPTMMKLVKVIPNMPKENPGNTKIMQHAY